MNLKYVYAGGHSKHEKAQNEPNLSEINSQAKYRLGRVKAIRNIKGYTSCLCNAGFESGIVLDPFMGSGTTALVALKLNRSFMGFELNQSYIDIANERLKPYLEQTKLNEIKNATNK